MELKHNHEDERLLSRDTDCPRCRWIINCWDRIQQRLGRAETMKMLSALTKEASNANS